MDKVTMLSEILKIGDGFVNDLYKGDKDLETTQKLLNLLLQNAYSLGLNDGRKDCYIEMTSIIT